MLLDDPQDIIDYNPPQPNDKFPHRLAAELAEIAMGLEKRFLDDIRRADADPQAVVELGGNQQFQVVCVEREQLAQARAGAGPSRRKQLIGTMLRASGHAWSLRISQHYGQRAARFVTANCNFFSSSLSGSAVPHIGKRQRSAWAWPTSRSGRREACFAQKFWSFF